MDEIDLAQVMSERYLKGAIARARGRAEGESLEECEECGRRIPEARRKAVPGCTRCVGCQEAWERGFA